jgi:hypothetical protein
MSKPIAACRTFQTAFDKAKAARKNEKVFSKGRATAKKKESSAKRDLKGCEKANGEKGGVVYTKGLARAAKDANVKFGLKPDFHKGKGLFKADDEIRKAYRIKSNKEIMPASKKFAKKHGLDEAAQHASAVYVLKSVLAGTQAGFITAQVALAVLDVVAGIVTLGGYAAAAPAAHIGVAAGQTVSIAAIKSDMQRHETLYTQALEKRAAKVEAREMQKQSKELAALQKQADTAAGVPTQAAQETPWYMSNGAKIGAAVGTALLLFGGIAAARRN